ncbi:hypothetical protein BSL78_18290 [Apostichopus japonicus]|uniref:Death domain-containing protein n=1 Tax=Stichopus japonicus TaxID=307972 RepID=A0A2G8KA22_STIJA|nr:hypothetical protein BSL78_18290 [Apostichopus japonicus]
MAGNDVQDQENTALASESLLQDLAGKLVGWKFLGRQLGLTEANLDDIEQDNRESKEKKYQTLLQWKRTSAQRPTIGCLANALKKVGRADLAVFVMQDGPVETSEDCYEIVQARAPSRDYIHSQNITDMHFLYFPISNFGRTLNSQADTLIAADPATHVSS